MEIVSDLLEEFLASVELSDDIPDALSVQDTAAEQFVPTKAESPYSRNNGAFLWNESRKTWQHSGPLKFHVPKVPASNDQFISFLARKIATDYPDFSVTCSEKKLRELDRDGWRNNEQFRQVNLRLRFEYGWLCFSTAKETVKVSIDNYIAKPVKPEDAHEWKARLSSNSPASQLKGKVVESLPVFYMRFISSKIVDILFSPGRKRVALCLLNTPADVDFLNQLMIILASDHQLNRWQKRFRKENPHMKHAVLLTPAEDEDRELQ